MFVLRTSTENVFSYIPFPSMEESARARPVQDLLQFFKLKDLLLGGEYNVKEKAATSSLRKWDIFAARLLHIDGNYILSGAVYPYHLKQKEMFLEDINAEFEYYRLDFPDATQDEFLKKNSEIFNFYWYDIIQHPTRMNLATASGEPFLYSKLFLKFRMNRRL
jgi:hypothetical protein